MNPLATKPAYVKALIAVGALAVIGWLLNRGSNSQNVELVQTGVDDMARTTERSCNPLSGDAGEMLANFEQTIAMLERNQVEHPDEVSEVLRRMRDRDPDRFNLACAEFFKGSSFSKYPGMHWGLVEALSGDVRSCAELIESVPVPDRKLRLYDAQFGAYEGTNQSEPLWLLFSEVLPPGEASKRAACSSFRNMAKSGEWQLVRQRMAKIPYRECADSALQGIFQSFTCNKGPKPTVEEWRGIVGEARKLGARNNYDDILVQGEREIQSK